MYSLNPFQPWARLQAVDLFGEGDTLMNRSLTHLTICF